MRDHLIFPSMLHDFLIHNLIHDLKSLDRFLLRDPNELLLQRNRSETVVKKVQPLRWVHPQKRGHVLVVRQGSAEPDQSHVLLGCLNISYSPVTAYKILQITWL